MSAVLADACWIEPERIVLERVEVRLERLSRALDGLRIVQLSDFHYTNPGCGELIRNAVSMANSLNPDLVALTGDYVTSHRHSHGSGPRNAVPCAAILGELHAPLGIFAVLGNHDQCGPDFISRMLESHGIAVLRNRALHVERAGARLWVAGVNDVLESNANIDEALQFIPQPDATILLAHEPDYADVVRRYPVDLQLSGHSHGGQIRLPLVGSPYLPLMATKYPRGLRQLDGLSLYTNRGLGTTFVPVRFDSAPEVTLLTLRSKG